MHIEWGPKYEVHVRIIDEQHKETVRLFNLLDDLAAGHGSPEEVSGVIDQAMAHLQHHIATEEHYFDEFQYEHAAEHKMAHRTFMVGVEQVLEAYRHNPDKILSNVLPLLAAWLDIHTAIHDKKYVDCFHQHGLDGTTEA